MNKKLALMAFILVGAGSAAFAANPTTVVYPTGDTSYVGPAGTSIGTYFTQTEATGDSITGGCQLDSSGYENPATPKVMPHGLTLVSAAGRTACNITGTPTSTTNGTETYGIENLNSTDSGSAPVGGTNYVERIQLTITPTSLVYAQNPGNYTIGVPVSDTASINKTGVTNPITYSVAPALPAGLSLNANTGAITGTPTTAAAAANYVVTASVAGADFNTYTTTATLSISVQAASSYTAWAHSKVLKINTTGFTLTAPVTNYPLLIELTNANAPTTDNFDFSQASATGADIRFSTTRNGITVNLPYQIEQWAPGSGKSGSAVIWVSVDTMYVNDSTHSITMYWGNGSAVAASSGPAVFSKANGYQGVWHMNGGSLGTTAAASSMEPDVTGNNFHMHPVGVGPVVKQGFIGLGSTAFDPNDYLLADGTGATPAGYGAPVTTIGSVVDFPMLAAYTISAWANPGITATYADQAAILSKGNQQYQLQSDANKWENTEYVYLKGALTSGAYETYSNNQATAAIATGWHYVVGEGVNSPTVAQAGQNIYVDGAAVSHTNGSTAGTGYSGAHMPRINSLAVAIGSYPTPGSNNNGPNSWYGTSDTSSDGALDEISLSNVTRSADWVTLNFQTQCYGSTYTSLGGTGCTTVAPVVNGPLVPGLPGAPTGVTAASTTAGQATISWTAPTATGTSAITSYKATAVQDTSKHCTATAPAVTCTVTGLTLSSYTFTVAAINSAGTGTSSAASSPVSSIFAFGSKTGFSLQMIGSSMLLHIPAVSGNMRVSIVDLWGRTVWNRTVAGNIGQLSWDGKSNTGVSTPTGMYVLRVGFQKGGGNPANSIQTTFVKP